MGRSMTSKSGKKRKVSITPSPELLAWILARTGEGQQFASLTHAVERGWVLLREHEEGKWVHAKK